MKRYKSVEDFFQSLDQWQPEMERLREIVLSMGLEETLKWSMAVYVSNKTNVCGLFATKNHFGI